MLFCQSLKTYLSYITYITFFCLLFFTIEIYAPEVLTSTSVSNSQRKFMRQARYRADLKNLGGQI